MKRLPPTDDTLNGRLSRYASDQILNRVVIGAVRIGRRASLIFLAEPLEGRMSTVFAFSQSDSGELYRLGYDPGMIRANVLRKAATATREHHERMSEAATSLKENRYDGRICFGSHYHHWG